MPVHVDRMADMMHRDYSSVLFLNDDFDGGELQIGETVIKPKAGMLVAFDADTPHQVLKITRGVRLTMPGFYTFDESKRDRVFYGA